MEETTKTSAYLSWLRLSLVFNDIVTHIWDSWDWPVTKKPPLSWQRTDTVWVQYYIIYRSDTEHDIVQKNGSYSVSIWQELACSHTDPWSI